MDLFQLLMPSFNIGGLDECRNPAIFRFSKLMEYRCFKYWLIIILNFLGVYCNVSLLTPNVVNLGPLPFLLLVSCTKEHALRFIDCIVVFVSISVIFILFFIISFHWMDLDLACSCLSKFLCCITNLCFVLSQIFWCRHFEL